IIGDLVAVDLAKAEVSRFRMCEVEAADAGTRPHGKRFRESHASVCLDIKQSPDSSLHSVIRASRVSRSRSNATILLVNELFGAQMFIASVSPFAPYALMQVFSECFRQAIREGFGHDGVVIVVLGAESVAQFRQSDAAGYRESPDV